MYFVNMPVALLKCKYLLDTYLPTNILSSFSYHQTHSINKHLNKNIDEETEKSVIKKIIKKLK